MSERRSWDIQPKPKRPSRASVDPALVRRAPEASRIRPAPREPLKARRRRARRVFLVLMSLLVLGLIAAAFYLVSRPAFRIQYIEASGGNPEELSAIAERALSGSYWGIVPHDSIFFFPSESVRKAILAEHPEISAVSVRRAGFDSISITALPRVAAFTWCGSSLALPAVCYEADAQGFLFAADGTAGASGTSTPATSTPALAVYAPLTNASGAQGIGSYVESPASVLGALQLDRALATLGARIVSIQLRGDEADLFTVGGTRITYVVGNESAAAQLAASSFPSINVNSGSLDYVDLRFNGKVYYKSKNEK